MTESTAFLDRFRKENALVRVLRSAAEAGRAAAVRAAELIRQAIAKQGKARIIVATGNSQLPLVEALAEENLAWNNVEVFHMDEYAGMPPDHPASFRLWIKQRVEDKLHPSIVHYIQGDASDLKAEMRRYAGLLNAAPIDLAFVGFGENGHIAFNDPHVANFSDPETIKVVSLDEACRKQQAGEGHFPDFASVPKDAITITCPGLFRAHSWVCCVPEKRKAEAVRNALEGPISEACPASVVRKHPDAHVFLDTGSASLLSRPA